MQYFEIQLSVESWFFVSECKTTRAGNYGTWNWTIERVWEIWVWGHVEGGGKYKMWHNKELQEKLESVTKVMKKGNYPSIVTSQDEQLETQLVNFQQNRYKKAK